MAEHSDNDLWIRRLLDVGRALMGELDQEAVLRRVLEIACEATGARYAAIGILNSARTALQRFVTLGVEEPTGRRIGEPPIGRGVLGVLIENPHPLRLDDVCQHPSSYGFPAAHPQMRSFLGVPVLIGGEAWGNLYLTEKQGGGSFTEEDEQTASMLAEWTAIAIENARIYETSEKRRRELEQAVLGLQATRDIAVAIGSDLSLEHALELIVQRGRALVGARSVVIMLCDGPDLVVSAGAGEVEDMRGTRISIAKSTAGRAMLHGRPQRIEDVGKKLQIAPPSVFGVPDPHTALLVPLLYGGEPVGMLAAFDPGPEGHGFTADDEHLLETFAASAATAVAMAQNAQSDRLRSALAAADAERRRWGRELHDETLQGLGGLRLLLSSALRSGDPAHMTQAAVEAIGHIEQEIKNLRSIISELRPAALDELGLHAAIETLMEHHRELHGLHILGEVRLPDTDSGQRLDPELEVGVYRLIQEALTNVVKHAQASIVKLSVKQVGEEVRIEVADDGVGFSPDAGSEGFGLVGMRERVRLAAGGLSIISSPGAGTVVRARLAAVSSEASAQSIASESARAHVEMAPAAREQPAADDQTPSSPRRSA